MTVACTPHVSSLARIVSVLHARGAAVTAFRYAEGAATSEVVIEIRSGQPIDARLLSAQLRRVIGVLSVDVTRPVVAVAS